MPFKINSVFNSATLSLANDSHKVIYVKRENISENPHNKEIYSTENIELLSYGIEDKGLLEPIIVSVLKKGDSPENTLYQIVSGHRRMLAISLLSVIPSRMRARMRSSRVSFSPSSIAARSSLKGA